MLLFDIGKLTIPSDYGAYASDFQTPPHICRYMISLLPGGIRTVLEPTPGLGNLVMSLQGYNVTAPIDFFLLDKSQRFDAVVMNPPFTANECNMQNAPISFLKYRDQAGYRILQSCMELSGTVICLLPWYTLINSNKRVLWLQRFGLKSITQVSRSAFPKLRVQCVILELNKGFTGDTVYKLTG